MDERDDEEEVEALLDEALELLDLDDFDESASSEVPSLSESTLLSLCSGGCSDGGGGAGNGNGGCGGSFGVPGGD